MTADFPLTRRDPFLGREIRRKGRKPSPLRQELPIPSGKRRTELWGKGLMVLFEPSSSGRKFRHPSERFQVPLEP
ncbi:hypothetical protein B6U90_00485 [Thermoplasmatales archaeon ex4484_6]|nr:MAG: hypothetical protein B6U90_00485 [Thermoplasmatales archaeon ex4484_6]RLF69472.1 MAG: hypothetical protein DRN57_00765 [Thermoplasmata archaeon]